MAAKSHIRGAIVPGGCLRSRGLWWCSKRWPGRSRQYRLGL